MADLTLKAKVRQKVVTSAANETSYLASLTPFKGDSYILVDDNKAVLKVYDGTSWIAQDAGMTEEEVEAVVESVRLQVTESSDGNIVISSLGAAPVTYVVGDSTSTTKTYSYDGNYSTSGLVWAKSSSNLNVAVKVGNYPSGTLVLTGQSMKGIVKNNSYLNWETTITDDMLDRTQSNAIIINYKNQSRETQAITRAICVKTAGSYTLQYDGFTDAATFTEAGIYLIDHNSLGADDYTSELEIKVTTISGGTSGDTTTASSIDYKGNEILMFNSGICIGDSITEGMVNYSGGSTVIGKYSYPTILGKRGLTVSNQGVSGATVSSWLTQKQSTITNAYDFAIVQLGINDCLDGVDTTTFSTNMGTLLGKLKALKIKTFLCTLTPAYSSANSAMAPYNEIIRALVPAFKEDGMDIYLIDLAKYSKCLPNTSYVNTHLTALGYTQMANEIYAMISYQISQNLDDFNDVQFIGTNYTM